MSHTMLPANDRWAPATWTAIATVLVVALLTSTATWQWQASRQKTAESAREMDRAQSVLRDLIDMETGQRGFLLTSEDRYLEPYSAGSARLKQDLEALHSTLSGDAQRTAWGRMIDEITTRRIAELDSTILYVRASKRDESLAIVRSDRGKALMDSLRGVLAEITTYEQARQQAHVQDEDRWALAVRVVLGLGTLLTLGVLLFLRNSLASYAAEQRAAAREMEHQLAELEAQSRALAAREHGEPAA